MHTRFDVALALYHYLSQYQCGQWTSEYRRLSRLLRYFKPSPTEECVSVFDRDGYETSKEIFERLVSR
jgi:hypothetical protein